MPLAQEVELLIPALASLPMAVTISDRNAVVCWANACFADLTGYAAGEIAGHDAGVLPGGHPAFSPPDTLRHVIATGEPWKGEFTGRRKDGQPYTVLQAVTPIRDSSGSITHSLSIGADRTCTGVGLTSSAAIELDGRPCAVSTTIDITGRKSAEEALRQTNELLAAAKRRYNLISENTADVIWLWDLAQERCVYVSPSVRQLRGFTPEEVLEQPMEQAFSPDTYRLIRALLQSRKAAVESGDEPARIGTNEVDFLRKDGSTVNTETVTKLVADDSVAVRYVLGITRDITERKRAEAAIRQANQALARSEAHYRLLFNSGSDAFFVHAIGPDGLPSHFLDVNDHACRYLGYTREELLRMRVSDIAAPELQLDFRVIMQNLLSQGQLISEGKLVAKNGWRIPVEVNTRLLDLDGSQTLISCVRDLTARNRIYDALWKSEERFSRVFRSNPTAISLCDLDDDFRLLDVNDAFERISGYHREELIGRPISDLGLWADLHEFDETLNLLQADGRIRNFEYHFRKKNGEAGVGLISVELIELDGRRCAISATLDITEQREAEKRLQAEGKRFQEIVAHTDAGYFRLGVDGRYEDVNAAWLRMHKFANRQDAIGLHFSAVQNPDDVAKAAEVVEDLVGCGPARTGEFSRQRRDGTIGYHSFSANPVFDGERVAGVEGFLIDISDRKEAEQERQHTEQRYRSLFDSMQEGVAIHKLIQAHGAPENYILLEVNRRYEEILGVRREDVVNKAATDVYGIEGAPYLKEYAAVVRTGTPTQFETYFPPMDKHFVISVAPMGDEFFATIFFDVTEAKKAAGTMKSLVTAMEQTSESILITDLDGTIRYCNPAFEKVTGYSKVEAIGQNPRVLKSGKHGKAFYERLWATIGQGQVWAGHLTNRKKDGSLFEEDATISPIRDLSGQISGFVAVKRDVTDRLHLEDQLRQAQKLESIGRLAGGVAHDFNNLLTVINGYSAFLLKGLKAGDPLRSHAEEIKTAGDRAARLTKQLLAFSRKQIIEPIVLDLNTTIRESTPMLQRLIGEDIVLETHLDGCLGRVMADPDQIHQVIMNLAVNARDAMPAGGALDIETTNVEIDEAGGAAMHHAATPGRYVLMSVTDTGHGMDETIRKDIFEPFFTTKEVGKGTGLGLSTVYGIVRQNGGWIDVWSEVDVGTAFKMYFPRIDASPAPRRNGIATTAKGGGETVLVVEDQDAVRAFAAAALRQSGYDVLEAADGNEAIAVAERHQGRLHLLLTDVVMPGMNGKELSERLKELRPNLKVVLISGYTADVIAHRGVLDPGVAFLHKPFSPEELTAKVREALTDRSEPD
jgi:PAS domain S-box-containing protein